MSFPVCMCVCVVVGSIWGVRRAVAPVPCFVVVAFLVRGVGSRAAEAQRVFLTDRNAVPALVAIVRELADPGSVRFAGELDPSNVGILAFAAALRLLMQGTGVLLVCRRCVVGVSPVCRRCAAGVSSVCRQCVAAVGGLVAGSAPVLAAVPGAHSALARASFLRF